MKRHLALLVIITALGIGLMIGCSAPLSRMISQQEIPSGIPTDVRTEIERLYDYRAEVRADAAQRLGRMGERAVPAIKFLLATVVAESSIEAARAILNTGTGRAVLVSVLTTNKNPLVREKIVGVLMAVLLHTKDLRAVEPLIAALGDPVEWLRGVVKAFLVVITKQDFGHDQKKWQAWWERNKGAIQDPTELAAQKPSEATTVEPLAQGAPDVMREKITQLVPRMTLDGNANLERLIRNLLTGYGGAKLKPLLLRMTPEEIGQFGAFLNQASESDMKQLAERLNTAGEKDLDLGRHWWK